VILPLLGKRLVKDLTYQDVKDLHRNAKKGGHETNANRAVAVLSRLLSIAEKEGLRPAGSNPCAQLEKPSEKPRSRVLSTNEYAALEEALVCLVAAGQNEKVDRPLKIEQSKKKTKATHEVKVDKLDPQAADLIRFLALSGLRKGEALGLRFADVDLERSIMRFEDHKTSEQAGTKVLPLNAHLKAIIQRRATQQVSAYVFPGRKLSGPIVGLAKMWARVMESAHLIDVTPHDLRRTFMSTSMELGYPAAIGDSLLGHSLGKIRDTYVNLGSEGIMATASQETADWIAAALAGVQVRPGVKVTQKG
jgi:integrase